jgi:CRP-like cAMP-binding protein
MRRRGAAGTSREGASSPARAFADLDHSEQAQVAALMRPFEVASGEVLFREGEIADRL